MMVSDFDLFFFWRRVLMIACTIYALIQLGQTLYTWYVRLKGRDRYSSIARQYLLIQMLRISPRKFAWELFGLAALSAILLVMIFLHIPLNR